jgi:hypothetical protein
MYTDGMYPYWHDSSHGYKHRRIAREERVVERGRFVATPGTVEVAQCSSVCVERDLSTDCCAHFLAPL